MNKWIKKVVALSFIVAQFLVVPNVSASSLEEIQNQKNSVEQEVNQLQKEVNVGLESVSEISIALDKLNNEIAEHKQAISDAEKDIDAQEIVVEQRFEYTAEQLQSMQTNEVNNNIVLSIFQSESLTDLVNTIYSASVLTSASEDRLSEAQDEHEKLNEMRETLLAEQEALDSKQVEVVQQKEALDNKVAELQKVLAANQDELNELNAKEEAMVKAIAEREAAQKRAAEERAAAQRAATAKAAESKETKVAKETKAAPVSTTSSSKAAAPKPEEKSSPSNGQSEQNSSSAGEWMTVQATGYSTQQKGLSTHTRMGIDLRVNPRVIAVDPRIIPLGSLVEVQGMGVYVAGDTGGAIKGKIIDIHYPTVSQALNWGRRNVKIRIIN